MSVAPPGWCKLSHASIEALPDSPGIFEIATLVRSVVLIGRAGGSLRRRLRDLGPIPPNLPLTTGGYYVRAFMAPNEDTAYQERLRDFRSRHDGALPCGNAAPSRPVERPARAA